MWPKTFDHNCRFMCSDVSQRRFQLKFPFRYPDEQLKTKELQRNAQEYQNDLKYYLSRCITVCFSIKPD